MFQGPSSLVLDIPCLYDFIIITIKGITVEKISKVNQVIYSSSPISIPSFKAKAQTVFERFRYYHITRDKTPEKKLQGPVVQSIVSLTVSLRVNSLTVLADSIYNIDIFC